MDTLALTQLLDQLKSPEGNYSPENVKALAHKLSDFGPYYSCIISQLAEELKECDRKKLVLD
jgi:hypothetical protein